MEQPTTRDILDAMLDFRTAVELRFDEHDKRFDGIDRRLGRLETRIEAVER